MPRYIPRSKSPRKTAAENAFERALESQRKAFLQLLERESQSVLRDFQKSLEISLKQELRNVLSDSGTNASAQTGGVLGGNISGIGNLLSRGIGLLINRPRFSKGSKESARSASAQQAFRTARTQQITELNSSLSSGQRNA
jgi:hypothetical protein